MEYLITSYLYSAYPDLKPGQITDLRSITVNNNSFAHMAVWKSLHKYLIKDSNSLTEAVKKLETFIQLPESERELLEEPACPKVFPFFLEILCLFVIRLNVFAFIAIYVVSVSSIL